MTSLILHNLILFLHVLSAFLYLLAHGGSVAVAFRIRRETNAERAHALLELSRSTVGVAGVILLSTVIFGVALGFLGHWWSARWIWISIVTLVIVLVVMGRVVAPRLRTIRETVGAMLGDSPSNDTVRTLDPRALAQVLESGNPVAITVFAMGGWAVILWLMLFKPF
jgi:hypothetical protein